jgi:hypothetical protein
MPDTPAKIRPGEYAAVVKPKPGRASSRAQTGVLLVLQPPGEETAEQVFSFSSWKALRESFWVFGFATATELDCADVRLSTGRQPYMFSRRRWEAPLIDALYGNCDLA